MAAETRPTRVAKPGRIARNTAIFSILTGPVADRGPGPGDRRVELLRHERRRSRRSRSPSRCRTSCATCSPTPRCQRRVRAGLHRAAGEGPPARGVPARVDVRRADRRGADGDLRLLRARRAVPHAAADAGDEFTPAARRAHGRPVAGAVPDRPAARPQRAARRDPQRLRPLHDPGARAARVELRDHRAARRAASRTSTAASSSTPTRSRSLAATFVQLAMAVPVLRGWTSSSSARSTSATRASSRCSRSCCR